MPRQLSNNLTWEMANPILCSTLNPFIANVLNNISIIEDVNLVAGKNVINHSLGHNMNGWFIVDIQGIATIYRSAPMNNLTLQLTVSAPVTASIGVF